jgi:phosphopantetheinyl transferase
LDIDKIEIKKDGNKWVCNECYFSLSHSENVAAVAISRTPVGVDIEKLDGARFLLLPQEKLLTESEQAQANIMRTDEKGEYVCSLWTVKEAAFKMENGKNFKPNQIESGSFSYKTQTVFVDGIPFLLTAVGESVSAWKLYKKDGVL